MERPELLAEVNETIRRLAAETGSAGQEWGFVCECGEDDCIEHVPLDLARYDELKAADVPVLAPGHDRVRAETRHRAADLRADSFALRSDATALQNQARHQHRRAARLADRFGWTSLDFRCASCGYGACGRTPPRSCPMCQGTRWQVLPPPRR
jgi:rubrerythrin